jgi:hypothetical protein
MGSSREKPLEMLNPSRDTFLRVSDGLSCESLIRPRVCQKFALHAVYLSFKGLELR